MISEENVERISILSATVCPHDPGHLPRDAIDCHECVENVLSKIVDTGAEQMREWCAKVNPLLVPCTFCNAKVELPCWQDGNPVHAHYTRWAAAIRDLPLREPKGE